MKGRRTHSKTSAVARGKEKERTKEEGEEHAKSRAGARLVLRRAIKGVAAGRQALGEGRHAWSLHLKMAQMTAVP